jgi:AAA family ATP:ADP antiporter
MTTLNKADLSPLERFLSLFTKIHPLEGRSVAYLFANSFLLMLAYYLLKPVREALILSEGGAELRSYAVAMQAVLLLVAIPIYGKLFQGRKRLALLRTVIFFFAGNLALFFVLGQFGVNIGLPFFIWLGILSVTLVAQFWAFAADIYSVEAGHRLFAFIAVGSTLGSLVGAKLSSLGMPYIGAYGMMLTAAIVLSLSVVLSALADRAIPPDSRGHSEEGHTDDAHNGILSGFSIVLKDRYLLLIGLFVMLLNCINSTGEFILAKSIVAQSEANVLADATHQLTKGDAIGNIYGDFYFYVNLFTLLIQLLLVRRIWQVVGIQGALLILPIIVFLGYGAIGLFPIFTLIYVVKIIENSTDYSIQNTTRHALFLPVDREKKYKGKTCIDTFLWRLGDLIQALLVYVGMNLLNFDLAHFAMVNFALSTVWLAIAVGIGFSYKRATAT